MKSRLTPENTAVLFLGGVPDIGDVEVRFDKHQGFDHLLPEFFESEIFRSRMPQYITQTNFADKPRANA